MNDQAAELVKALGMTISDYDMETRTMEPCVWWPLKIGDCYLGLAWEFDPFYDIERAVEIANLFCNEHDVNWELIYTAVEKRRIFQICVTSGEAVLGQSAHVDPATALCEAVLKALPELRKVAT